MRTTFTAKTLLALSLAPACAGVLGASALADTGGVSSTPRPAPHVKPTAHKTSIATWFGPGFYGRKTACGQTLTPAVVGVANRTLPCGTLVAVGYHGRRLTVPVIDRGPYAGNGADWDLTFEAARALGVAQTVRIAARVVGRVPNSPTLGLPPAPAPTVATGGSPPGGGALAPASPASAGGAGAG